MKKVALYVLGLGLVGCGNGDISALKDSTLDAYPAYTVGQAFDNRKVCESAEWDSFTGARDQLVIEYRCVLRGVSEFVDSQRQAHIEKVRKDQAREIRFLDMQIEETEKDLNDAKERLVSATSEQETWANLEKELEGWDNEQHELQRRVELLSQNSIDELAAVEFDGTWYHKLRGDLSRYGKFKREYAAAVESGRQDAVAYYKKSLVELEGEFERSRDMELSNLHGKLERLQRSRQSLVERHKQSVVDRVGYANTDITNYGGKLKELLERKSAGEATSEARFSEELEKFDQKHAMDRATEVIQWQVGDGAQAVIVYAGLEQHYSHKDLQEVDFQNYNDVLNAIYNDEIEDYGQYVRYVAGSAWSRFLGY